MVKHPGGLQIAAIKDSLLKNNNFILQNTSYRNSLHHAECLVSLKWPYYVVYLDMLTFTSQISSPVHSDHL